MSNLCKRMVKQQKAKVHKAERKERKRKLLLEYQQRRKYTSFNIFTRDGENLVVSSDRPMTLEEARQYYKALSISGND